jgi:hypothetical protein
MIGACQAQATPTSEPSPIPPTEKPTPAIYTLNVTVDPPEAGSVSPMSGEYESGTDVTLIAEPIHGFALEEWSGDAYGDTTEFTVVMHSDKSITAKFVQVPALLLFDVGTTGYEPHQTGNLLMDFDSDGDLDLILSQFDRYWAPADPMPVLAFRNDGSGVFLEATEDVFAGLPVETITARHHAVDDFNGDGREDLFIADSGRHDFPDPGGQSILLIQNDSGQLIDETEARLPQQQAFTHNVAVGDIDGDGDVDIYMCNVSGPSPVGPRIYVNDGEGFFVEDTNRLPSNVANLFNQHTSCLFLDVDQDDDLDLVLGGRGGTRQFENSPFDTLLTNDGDGFFTTAYETDLPPRLGGMEAGTIDISTADFDQDGLPDLLMSTHLFNQFGQLQLLLNNGDGTFRDESARIEHDWSVSEYPNCGQGPGSYWIMQTHIVDSNQDGFPDILAQGSSCAMHVLLENSGGESFSVVETMSDVWLYDQFSPTTIVPGDVNGDGVMDAVLLYPARSQQVLQRAPTILETTEGKATPQAAPTMTATVTIEPLPTQTPVSVFGTPAPPIEVFRDDFEGSLDAGWSWIREEEEQWSLTERPGYLRLTILPAGYTRNLLLREAPEGRFEITTRVQFTPTSNFQFAGLQIYQDKDNFLRLGRAFCQIDALPGVCVGNGIYFDNLVSGEAISPNVKIEVGKQYEAYLKIVRDGSTYTGFYSDDGETWILVGQHRADLRTIRVGLITSGSSFRIVADFDYFTINEMQ